MSIHQILATALCGVVFLIGSAQAQTPSPTKESRTCKLRFGWWEEPENLPELALQVEKDRVPVSPNTMSLSQIVEYQGEPTAVLLKKTLSTELDKTGKPIEVWLPYCTIPVSNTDTDIGVLLFPDEKRGIARTQLYDFSHEAFPYGSIQLVNFSTVKIAVAIDGVKFVTNSKSVGRCPTRFTSKKVSSFTMAALEANGEQKILRSTTMVFRPNTRILLFVMEIPSLTGKGRFNTAIILDNFVERPAAPIESSESNGQKSSKTKAKIDPSSKTPATSK